LEIDFHKEMLDIYRNAKEECGYNATRFLQMVSNDGGLKTAQKLLATSEPSDGFTVLWEHGRLDLTVENLVLKPKFQVLFTSAEIDKAKTRLEEYGYLK
jgi:hypothetical protein